MITWYPAERRVEMATRDLAVLVPECQDWWQREGWRVLGHIRERLGLRHVPAERFFMTMSESPDFREYRYTVSW